jgi:hypothetical protein
MVIAAVAVHYAFAVLEKIESKGGTIDSQTMMDAVNQASSNSESFIINLGQTGICPPRVSAGEELKRLFAGYIL